MPGDEEDLQAANVFLHRLIAPSRKLLVRKICLVGTARNGSSAVACFRLLVLWNCEQSSSRAPFFEAKQIEQQLGLVSVPAGLSE